MSDEIKIGTILWWRNSRDRRQGWKSCEVTGETRQSWLVGDLQFKPRKVNKKTMLENNGNFGHERFYTSAGKEALGWIGQHRGKIVTALQFCDNVDHLKQVASILEVEL